MGKKKAESLMLSLNSGFSDKTFTEHLLHARHFLTHHIVNNENKKGYC